MAAETLLNGVPVTGSDDMPVLLAFIAVIGIVRSRGIRLFGAFTGALVVIGAIVLYAQHRLTMLASTRPNAQRKRP